MARKQRSDSAAAAVKAAMDAAAPLPALPAHVKLRAGDAPFLESVLRARARDEWTGADLVIGAQLARCQADIEREQGLLDAEGSILENARGTKVMNPRVTVLEQLSRRELALMRSLCMAGVAKGDKRDMVKARSLQHQAEVARGEIQEEDGLLA